LASISIDVPDRADFFDLDSAARADQHVAAGGGGLT